METFFQRRWSPLSESRGCTRGETQIKTIFFTLSQILNLLNTVLVFPELRTDGPVDQEHDGRLGDLELSR